MGDISQLNFDKQEDLEKNKSYLKSVPNQYIYYVIISQKKVHFNTRKEVRKEGKKEGRKERRMREKRREELRRKNEKKERTSP